MRVGSRIVSVDLAVLVSGADIVEKDTVVVVTVDVIPVGCSSLFTPDVIRGAISGGS